jgi:hypothetical protein
VTTRWAKEAVCWGLPGVVLAGAIAASRLAEERVVAAAVALDLTITAPALVYLLLVRTGRVRWTVLLPVTVLGYALAAATIPQAQQGVLTPLRALAIPAEIGLLAYLVLAARKAVAGLPRDGADIATRFRLAAERVLPSRIAAGVLTTEAMLLYYALRGRSQSRDEGAFTVHREVAWLPLLIALGMALITETVAVHFLVRLGSPAAAWVLTGLSLYALLWLVGDARALVSRPIRVTATHLQFRFGMRWEADIPLERIAEVRSLPASDDTTSREQRLTAVLLGEPNLRLRLEEPVEVLGLYGWRRKVVELRLRVDNVARLRAMLNLQ